MATNTGIEVTALRPAASAGDFYVRPEAKNSGIAQGLERLAGTMAKKEREAAKLTAENIHISDSLNNAKDLLNFEAYTQESPAVIAHLKELRGKAYANQWRTETEDAYNTFKMNSDETGLDYATFMAERKAELGNALQGDRFLTSGALSVINETDHNLRAVHRSYLDNRMRSDVKVQMGENLAADMDSMKKGTMSIQDVALAADDMVQLTHDTGGLDRSEGNSDMFKYAVAKYRATGDYDYYLLAQNLRFAKGAKGQVNAHAQATLEAAQDEVQAEAARVEASITRKAVAKKAADIQGGWNAINNALFADADAEIPADALATLLGNGVTMAAINSQRTAIATRHDTEVVDRHHVVLGALMAQIAKGTFSDDGTGITHDSIAAMVKSGDVHPTHIVQLTGAIAAAEKVTPLLHGVEVKAFKKTMLDEIKNSFMYKTPSNATRVATLERKFDERFSSYIQDHYTPDDNGNTAGTPTPSQLRGYAKQAEFDIKDSKDATIQASIAFDDYVNELETFAETSKKDNGFISYGDATLDQLNQLFSTPEGRELQNMLKQDPTMESTFNDETLPVAEILDLMMEVNEFGTGGFNAWYELNSGIFTEAK
jgi:hypothetical protein